MNCLAKAGRGFAAALVAVFATTGVCADGAPRDFASAVAGDPELSTVIFRRYKPVATHETSAPAGYHPFYISHYGRHGSRYQSERDNCYAARVMAKADAAGILTDEGRALFKKLKVIRDAHEGMYGELSARGAAEHRGIARRMFERVPEVFRAGRKVRCETSTFTRCNMSLANFACELKGLAPVLDFEFKTGERLMSKLLSSSPKRKKALEGGKAAAERILSATFDRRAFMARLFTDTARADEMAGESSLFIRSLFYMFAACRPLEVELAGLTIDDCFTKDELVTVARMMDARWYALMGNSAEFGDCVVSCAAPLAEDFAVKADEAITHGGIAADLRFGHDAALWPFVCRLGVEGAGDSVPMAEAADHEEIISAMPMAANVQMIFYRNGAGDVIVKVLFNEGEARLRGLETVYGAFYRWADLKARLAGRSPAPPAAADAKDVREIDLAGRWQVSDCERTVDAFVPGGVHDALLKAGVIDDIYWGANEKASLWVARRDWTFSRRFNVDGDFLRRERIILRLEDCDTFCTVKINGRDVGRTANRFRRYDFDVKPFLKKGENIIEGVFRSPVAEADERRAATGRAYPISNVEWAKNQALIRKPACHAGWDWGPEVESIGFCGTVKLLAADRPLVDYVYTTQKFTDDLGHCTLDVFADLSDGSTVTNRIEIDNPPLWWPNGAGGQNFYTFTVDVNGEKITKRIGLRKLEVLNERTVSSDGKEELSLVFCVNNRRLFMKGANWIPCDALETRQTPSRYRDLLESAKAANMNMIRVWGGGQYEKDVFYDLCDELGLLVWHDMMHACAVYPADDAFLGEIEGELSHQLRRLRDHASIALWCGDNECLGAIRWFKETREDPDFYKSAWIARSKRQGELVARYDPARTYWPSSPCCGPGDFGDAWKDDSKGDMHNWDVWHENAPFSRYYKYRPRFCSEFGYQSFPSPEVAATFSKGPGDDFEWHQKNPGGNRRIRETMVRYFGEAKDFESELILSQFQQGMAIRTAVEGWRAAMPRCMGTLFWQLNDNWPVASWSSVEYGGKWKPLQYMARRFFEPVAVVARPGADGAIEVYGLNDTACEVRGELEVEYWPYGGRKSTMSRKTGVVLSPNGATRLTPLGITESARRGGEFVVLTLRTDRGVSQGEWHFVPYREAAIEKARVTARATPAAGGTFSVELSSDRPAFFVWLDVRGVRGEFSDNCFTLLPGRDVTVVFTPKSGESVQAEEFAARLKVLSLSDLLQEPRLERVKLSDEVDDGRPKKRWRGVNLLDMLSIDYNEKGGFKEEDFEILQDFGFNFARLPLDYRYWIKGRDRTRWTEFDEDALKLVDEAVEMGRRHKIHVQLCLHRIPGYTSGVPAEPTSIFDDDEALKAACLHWATLAGRYRGIPGKELSFNLFNEPDYMREAKYARVVRELVAAIRAKDPERFIVADGLGYGRIAPTSLCGVKGLGFGWHCYDPFFVTHHQTPWNDPKSVSETPRWPVDSTDPRKWLIKDIYTSKEWDDAIAAGTFVCVGEFGVWKKTRHDVALGLMEDQLRLWRALNCGWALWGLYGGFGILDSGRDDVEYEDYRGHKLDRKMLELLKRY